MQILGANELKLANFTPAVILKLEKMGIRLKINPEDRTVEFEADDPYTELRARDFFVALSFMPRKEVRKAFRIFSEDCMLKVVDLSDFVGDEKKDQRRVMARIIGAGGKTKIIMEEITETNISVLGHKICIIGTLEGVELASAAIEALIRGAPHKKVYRLLESGRRRVKEEKMRLWK